jgi:hypothetical protein
VAGRGFGCHDLWSPSKGSFSTEGDFGFGTQIAFGASIGAFLTEASKVIFDIKPTNERRRMWISFHFFLDSL